MVVEVIIIGDDLPQLAIGVLQIDPHPVPQLLVDLHYAARIAIPGGFARYAMDVVDYHRAHDPFSP
jgi:hypothetical protein